MPVLQTTITKSITLTPGEEFILPPNGTILGITGDLSSTCDNLPSPEALNCYYMQWEIADGSNNVSNAWEGGTIDKIMVGSTSYTVNADAFITNNNGATILTNVMKNIGGLLDITTYAESITDDRINAVCFKTVPSIASKLTMYLHSNGRPGFSSNITQAQIIPRLLDSLTNCPCSQTQS